MDLGYLTDAFSHMTVRVGALGRYDPWGRGWAPEDYGLTVAERHRIQNKQKKLQEKKQNKPCPICLENKRRALGTYIRQKSQENSDALIEEDEERTESSSHAQCHSSGVMSQPKSETST